MFWNFIEKDDEIELRIDGDIVDDGDVWIYEWLGEMCSAPNKFRNELKKYSGRNLTVWIDSYGGNVFAGAGIYNALVNHKGKVTVKVDGKAMSIAATIAMAADEVLMSPVGVMMIHNPWSQVSGDMHEMRKMADVLDTIKESIINAFVIKTGKTEEEISSMMDDDTWMSSNVAVKEGFADGVIQSDPEVFNSYPGIVFNRVDVLSKSNQAIEKFMSLERSNRALNNAQLCLMKMKGEQNEQRTIFE